MRDLPLFGTGLGYRWQGFLIYFVMWVYGIVLALNGIPFLNGEFQTELMAGYSVKYLPYLNAVSIGMGVALVLFGAAIVVTRFLLARFKRCALPVFFTVSVVDLLGALAFPLAIHLSLYPLSRLVPLGELYAAYFSSAIGGLSFHTIILRAVLLVLHSWYYYRRRTDFRN